MDRIASIVAFALLCSALIAGPDAATMQNDLSTIYKTTALTPDLSHAGSQFDRRIQSVAIRQAGYQTSLLKPIMVTTGGLSLTKSKSIEHGIRPNARTASGLAMMVQGMTAEDFPTTLTREKCRDDALGILRFLLYTHGAGGVKCTDGKQWNGQWQSALWANSAGLASWLLWDDLTPEMQWLAARMICDEADRFVGKMPPSNINDDTKAEENAWNSTVISLAACMFPQHPRHDDYLKTAKRWAVGSFVRQADLNSSRTIDGETLAQWDVGPTLHDDYTMENHHRVHPDYMNTINLNLDQWLPYSFAGATLPEAFRFNTEEIYTVLETLTFPDAGYIYINGQDWQLHRNCNWLPTYLHQAVINKDKAASLLAERSLETAEKMLGRNTETGIFQPEEFSFPSTQGDVLEMYTLAHLLVAKYGDPVPPMNEDAYWKSLEGVHIFQAGSFALMRTAHSVATFSWGDQPMGMVLPLQKDLLWAPNERSLIGTVTAADVKKEQPKVKQAKARQLDDHLVVTGVLSRCGGAVDQRFAFIALGDGRTVYVDDLTVLKRVAKPEFDLGIISVLNDKNWVFHDGKRDLYWGKKGTNETEKITFNVNDETTATKWTRRADWYNLDNALGVVMPGVAGLQVYQNNKKIGNGRLEQQFVLNSLRSFNGPLEASSKPYTYETLVFYPGQTATETAAIGPKVKRKWPEAGVCLLVLEDGVRLQINLNHTDNDGGVYVSYPPGDKHRTDNKPNKKEH